MKSVWKLIRFIGRILFISLLVKSALINIKEPSLALSGFEKNQNPLILNSPLNNVDNKTLLLVVRTLGVFEGLTAIMILFGDAIGGLFFTLYIGVRIVLVDPVYSEILDNIGNCMVLLGCGLILMDQSNSSRHHPKLL